MTFGGLKLLNATGMRMRRSVEVFVFFFGRKKKMNVENSVFFFK